MKIILHIGWHKTGSTAIQQFLFQNRQELLEKFGILYPETGRFTVAHHHVAWSLQQPLTDPWALSTAFQEKAEKLFSGIFEEAKTTGASTLLISSEAFVPVNSSVNLDKMARLLSGHEVQMIAYIRRQDLAAESFYGQVVRQFESKSTLEFKTYVDYLDRWLDYKVVLDAWVKAFPDVILKPKIYDRTRFPQGNVVADFLATIGVAMPVPITKNDGNGDVNTSLSPLSIRTLSRVNAIYQLDKEIHERVVKLLIEMDADENVLQSGFFDSKARIAYLEQFKNSNQKLFHHWLGYPNIFSISAVELEHYAQQDVSVKESEAIKKALQSRLRKVAEYIANSTYSVKGNNMTNQSNSSVNSDKLATLDGADEYRDAAMVLIERGDWSGALEPLLAAHRLRPDGPYIRMLLGQSLLELGRAEEAKTHLDTITSTPSLEPTLSELKMKLKESLSDKSQSSKKKNQNGPLSKFKKRFSKR